MFETTTSAAAVSVKERDTARDSAHNLQVRESAAAPVRGTALGGSYVAAYGHPQSASKHAPRPAAGHGYTARFDGAGYLGSASPVDSYTAVFGSTGSAASTASRAGGSYTDTNL